MSESLTRRDSAFVHRNILYPKDDPAQMLKAGDNVALASVEAYHPAMTNSENAIAVAERIVSDAESKGDVKLETLAQAQAQTVLLKALLVEIAGVRSHLAAGSANRT